LLWLTGIPTRIGYKAGASPEARPAKAGGIPTTAHDLLQSAQAQLPCPEPQQSNVPNQILSWAESQQKRLGIQEGGGYI